jgi:uncharacterized membrane protein
VIESGLLLAGLIAFATALAFWLDRNVAILSKVGASLLAILLGAILSNTGIVVGSSPVYDAIGGPVTSLAIAWLLLAVRLADLKRAGPKMVGAFGIACVGTALGAFVGALIFADRFGGDTWRLAGTLTGTYSGGSVNFVAVGRAVELPDLLFAGTAAADNVMTAVWLGATLLLPLWLRRFFPAPIPGEGDGTEAEVQHPFFHREPLSTLDLAVLMAAGFVLLIAADWMGTLIPAVPSVLWLTTFALLAGHLTPLRSAPGAFQLGNLALHFFFVTIGINSRLDLIIEVGLTVFVFTAVVVVVHGLVVYGVGRMLNLDLGTLSVASQAAIGGPSSALAVAVSREWSGLVLPGIIVGLLGYAIGNYLGLAVGVLVRGLDLGI